MEMALEHEKIKKMDIHVNGAYTNSWKRVTVGGGKKSTNGKQSKTARRCTQIYSINRHIKYSKEVKRPTTHQINPRTHAHLLAGLHHLERLIEQDLSREALVDDLDDTIRQGEASPRRILLHADAASKSEFGHDTTT